MRPRLRANRRQNVFTETLEEITASLSSVCIGRLLSDIRTPRGPQSRGSDSGPGSSSVSWTTG
ncbi:Serine--pyruvate aminotransferase [Giardia duodenalis]|uniref:Serine--pyruvate aminotransferase n=1 Tax=Giardia intestinalis TaxID=5741 RepID=V6TZR2_GIAIN|nr:Serine--pyruvate aminotransferase [Giardia intestinalis]